jgi:hypothetical protein
MKIKENKNISQNTFNNSQTIDYNPHKQNLHISSIFNQTIQKLYSHLTQTRRKKAKHHSK